MKSVLVCLIIVETLSVKQRMFEEDEEILGKLHNDPDFDELELISEHPLGAKILQTVALQLKSGDGFQSITALLTNLKSDLEGKQIQQDGQNAAIQSQCKTDQDSYMQRIQLAINEINDLEFKINRMESDIDDLTGELELKQGQIDVFQTSETSLRELRLKQSSNYNKRLSQLKEMLQAFAVMLPKMMEFYDQSKKTEFIQEQAFADSFVQLSKVDIENPIVGLIQLSRMMDPNSLQTIIEKMETVRDSLEKSVQEETSLEEQSIRENDLTLNEIFNAMQALTREKASDSESLDETISARDQSAKRASDATAEFEAAKSGLKQRRNQCQELLVQYQQNTIERSKEIEIIKKVQRIISTKLNVVKAFVQDQQLLS